MTKYRNARIDNELKDQEINEEQEKILKTPVATEEEETWKKRYGDLRKHLQDKEAQARTEIEELRQTLSQIQRKQQESLAPPKTEEELEAWMKAYPDFAAINRTMIQKEVQEAFKREGIQDIKKTQAQLAAEKAKAALLKKHPDANEILASDNRHFHEWLKAQPMRAQDDIYRSFNVDNASMVINNYKLHLLETKGRRDDDRVSDRDTAKTVKVRSESQAPAIDNGGYLFTESQIQKSSSKWWDANEEKVLKALAEGKVLLDITGGAR